MSATLLSTALLLDGVLGEPRWLWNRLPHPVILFGRVIHALETRLNTGTRRRLKGTAAIAFLSAASVGLGGAIAALPLGPFWSTLIAAILLAHRSLIEHVSAVANALRISLPDARMAVSDIVGRDTAEMQETEIARAAIESAAENFSDGVVAPAFWFLVAGLPGILLYKIINTADSMIGYRTARFEEFGWAAARLDDILNWAPARLTAWLIAASHLQAEAWRAARQEGPLHRSPNAGWPEAALAASLDIALAGPRRYAGQLEDHPFVNASGRRALDADDIDRTIKTLWRCWWVMFGALVLLSLVT